jgi:hypothetical protein
VYRGQGHQFYYCHCENNTFVIFTVKIKRNFVIFTVKITCNFVIFTVKITECEDIKFYSKDKLQYIKVENVINANKTVIHSIQNDLSSIKLC